jgi:hypothetical protein
MIKRENIIAGDSEDVTNAVAVKSLDEVLSDRNPFLHIPNAK